MPRGFTLIELLVALAILAVVASAVVPLAQVHQQRQREKTLRQALWEIRGAIDAYKKASDEGRIRKEAGTTGYPKTLDLLVDGVEDQRDPKRRKIYFLRRLPRDPFDENPAAPAAASWATRSYASEPTEFREGADVYDVRSRSRRIGLDGVAVNLW